MRDDVVLTEGWRIVRLSTVDGGADALVAGTATGAESYPARMPAGVLETLVDHGVAPDPRLDDNAAASSWIGDEDWAYVADVSVPGTWRVGDAASLVFLGVDTIGEAYLDGRRIAMFDDMYREWTVDVADLLAPGAAHRLVVIIRSPARALDAVVPPAEHGDRVIRHHYLHKRAGDFASYLGSRPRSLKVGLFRDVVLSLRHEAWIDGLRTETRLLTPERAELRVETEVGGVGGRVALTLTDPDGVVVGASAADAGTAIDLVIPEPRLWWPRSHGPSPLYRLEVRLTAADGSVLDTRTADVGLRTVELVTTDPASGEERFQFVVNGQSIFLRGACWANVDGITSVWQSDRAERLFELVEHADMNALRVWGGGLVPEDDFYEECDRRGILVWQDFMFEYHVYPADRPEWTASVEVELAQQVRRLRTHPSIFVWVGGNESHMGWDFEFGTEPEIGMNLFDEMMPRVVREHDGTRPFHPNSPWGGRVANWPLAGDWHDYTTVTYSPRASTPLFVSETGRVSAPSMASMRRFLSPEALWPEGHDGSIARPGEPSWPPMWGYRAPDGAWDKIGAIHAYPEPRSAEDYVRVLGTAHGEHLRNLVDRLRRGRSDGDGRPGRQSWGNLVWRLNDPWPILYWSVVDAYLEPKIPYYFLRRAYAPVLVSFERTADELWVWVTNDSAEPVAGELSVTRRTFAARAGGTARPDTPTQRERLTAAVHVEPGESLRVLETADMGPIPHTFEYLEAEFSGRTATLLLREERYLHLADVRLDVDVAAEGRELRITPRGGFARQIEIDASAVPADAGAGRSGSGLGGVLPTENHIDVSEDRTLVVRLRHVGGAGSVTVRAVNAPPVTVTVTGVLSKREEHRS